MVRGIEGRERLTIMGGCVDVLRWAGASRFDAFDKLRLKRSPEPNPSTCT